MKSQIITIRAAIAVMLAAALLALLIWSALADCPYPAPLEGCGVDTYHPAVVSLPVVVTEEG